MERVQMPHHPHVAYHCASRNNKTGNRREWRRACLVSRDFPSTFPRCHPGAARLKAPLLRAHAPTRAMRMTWTSTCQTYPHARARDMNGAAVRAPSGGADFSPHLRRYGLGAQREPPIVQGGRGQGRQVIRVGFSWDAATELTAATTMPCPSSRDGCRT